MALQELNKAPSLDLDPFSMDFLLDPYPRHAQLRETGPVVFLEQYGIWAMARYAEVYATLHDYKTFISGAGAGIHDLRKGLSWRPPSLVLETDPPLHDQTRGTIGKIMSGPAVRKLRDDFQAEAERLADELVARGEFDAVSDFAVPYPLKVVGDAVGVSPEGRECLLPFSNMLFNSFGPENEIFRDAIREGERVVKQLFAQCERDALAPNSFGAKIYEAADAGAVTHQQAPGLVRAILSAGFDTTVNGLSSGLYAFATNPDQWQYFRETPAVWPKAFEEVIRWETPTQTFFRTTSRDVEVGGVTIPEGSKVLLFLGSANRDPERWNDPDKFDLTRNAAGHVGFGSGIHVCVGQMIARLEAEMLFGALAKRVAAFELAAAPVPRPNNTLRGFQSLPVRVKLH